jgi:subtilase family serine protease
VIAPSAEEIQPVMDWIRESGIEQIDASGRDHVKVVATIQQIERLFNAKIYYFQSNLTGMAMVILIQVRY